MDRIFKCCRAAMKKVVLFLLMACAQFSFADIPCPLKLIDGAVQPDRVKLTFRNTGKLPIQELELDCLSIDGRKARRAICRTESGLFYPGQQYDLDFQYTGKHKAVVLSLESAQLSDGSVWRQGPHQACKSLKALPSRAH